MWLLIVSFPLMSMKSKFYAALFGYYCTYEKLIHCISRLAMGLVSSLLQTDGISTLMIRILALAYFVGRTPISVRRPLKWRLSLLRSASTVTSYQKQEVPSAKAQEHVSHYVTPPQHICNFYSAIILDAVDWIAYLPEFFYHRSP